MATLTTKNFTTLVQEWAAVCQSSVAAVFPTQVLSFTKGSVFRALAEAQASVSLWLQGLILQLLTVTRLATSTGRDVDSFVNDFGLIRLPGNAASGFATFSRATPTNAATIPVGALVQSADGTQTFTVFADPTNTAYSAALNGFVILANQSSLAVQVQNNNVGVFGNVQAGALSILQTGISGVDSVTNGTAFTNGFNPETDAALKARFGLFIASLSKGTVGAIQFAVMSIQQGMQTWTITNPPPAPAMPPAVTMYVDDGSGAIPAATLAAAQAAANSYRAAGVSLGIFAATTLLANVNMTLKTSPGYNHAVLVAQASAAISTFISNVGLGNSLSYVLLVLQINIPGIIDVTGYSINGVTSDLIPQPGQTIKPGTILIV
jgi:phage-related baseplate assembly protein